VATFALIHGAGDVGWYWHLVEAELRGRGHDSVAPDLPCDDDTAGLSECADTVLQAIGDRRELIVVAQSAGAFTAPLVCERTPVELLVLVAGLIPRPGEAARDVDGGHDSALNDISASRRRSALTYSSSSTSKMSTSRASQKRRSISSGCSRTAQER